MISAKRAAVDRPFGGKLPQLRPPTSRRIGIIASVRDSEPIGWQVRTDERGLVWLDPGSDRPSLRAALEDCAETLSPKGQPQALSTYWVDRLLDEISRTEGGDVAHGNLWVLTARDRTIEVRMDVDPPDSAPLDVVEADDLARGLRLLRSQVLDRLANGHQLEDRYWSQRNC